MLATEANITLIDFESTGAVDSFSDEPWQVGVVLLQGGRVMRTDAFESLLRVSERPFNPYAPGRHERLRKDIARAPALPDLWPELRPLLCGRAVCAHNTSTEKRFLGRAFPLQKFGPWIDTLKLVRLAAPGLRSYKLEDVMPTMGLKEKVDDLLPEREPHDALYDAMSCGILLEHLLSRPEWEGVSLEALVHARPG